MENVENRYLIVRLTQQLGGVGIVHHTLLYKKLLSMRIFWRKLKQCG